MKELIIHEGPRVEQINSPIPVPKDDEIVIEVVVAGCNPKDYKTYWVPKPINQGDDIAGVVHQVGLKVLEFRPSDRVFALHQIQAPHGAYAEYAVASAATTAHLPPETSFEEAATIPLAAITAALGLYRTLSLPPPWAPRTLPGPLLIYGGSTAVGAFAIKLARAANLHPIMAVAGNGLGLVSSLLDSAAGDVALDYRNGPEQLQRDIGNALTASHVKAAHAVFDAVSENASWDACTPFLMADTPLATVLPYPETAHLPGGTAQAQLVMSGDVHDVFGVKAGGRDFGYVMMRAFARGLQEGWFSGHPFEVVPGGLYGVQSGLERLSKGEVSAKKLVYRIEETTGLRASS
ncbi:uncharacterized protein N0V89_008080 [Didymosphaeria variabile]|uniref:Enoyl reductase (ER) domain-containing protein n=1 Tax=Didymosphaeria variabile TaxID=1932322 RepID=A0A9W8XFL6_9PLEO|nr:uncharacterized protein N0V89_008080 [Didymosphaeria variabile]KAJ4349465.1 hypothetical protein N0V89_008080 [Didymosphaeria variabile]